MGAELCGILWYKHLPWNQNLTDIFHFQHKELLGSCRYFPPGSPARWSRRAFLPAQSDRLMTTYPLAGYVVIVPSACAGGKEHQRMPSSDSLGRTILTRTQ